MARIEISDSMMSNIVRHELRELQRITIEERDELLKRLGHLAQFESEDLANFELQIAALGMVLKLYDGDM